jgi:hypothetical protein
MFSGEQERNIPEISQHNDDETNAKKIEEQKLEKGKRE